MTIAEKKLSQFKPPKGLKKRLLYSHLTVAMLGVIALLVTLAIDLEMNFEASKLTQKGIPTVETAKQLYNSMLLDSALLWEELMTGDAGVGLQRKETWQNEIVPSLNRLRMLAEENTDQELLNNVSELERLFASLQSTQAQLKQRSDSITGLQEDNPQNSSVHTEVQIRLIVRDIEKVLDSIFRALRNDIRNELGQLKKISKISGILTIAMVLILLVFACFLSLRSTRRLIEPMAKLAESAEVLASGRKTLDIEVDGDDELSDLTRSFNRMNKSVQEKQKQILDIVESFHGVVWVIDATKPGRPFTYIGGKAQEIYGQTLSSILANPAIIRDTVHPKDVKKIRETFDNITLETGSFSIEERYFHPSKYLRFLRTLVTPVFEDGKLTSLRGVCIDISDEINKEKRMSDLLETIENSRREMNNLVNNIQGVVFQRDLGDTVKYTFVSDQVSQMLGYSPEEFYSDNRLFMKIMDKTSARRTKEGMERWDDDLFYEDIVTCHHKDGRPVYINSRISIIRDENNIPVKLNGVLIDITATVELEKKQKAMESQMQQSQKLEAVGQLAAGIAHEINTPSQFVNDNIHFVRDAFQDLDELIRLYDELCQSLDENSAAADKMKEIDECIKRIDLDYLRDDLPKAIEQSLDGMSRIATIVKAMKEFSHPGKDNMMRVDLNRSIESTITVARNEWKYVAELTTDFEKDLPMVKCMVSEINQTILNIIVNAAHAISEKQQVNGDNSTGSIKVSTRKDKDMVLITISDSGNGIEKEYLDRVFEPFFTTKEVGKGTGQGLSIAHAVIVEKHKGQIDVESQIGVGTTFRIWLPIENTLQINNDIALKAVS